MKYRTLYFLKLKNHSSNVNYYKALLDALTNLRVVSTKIDVHITSIVSTVVLLYMYNASVYTM